MHSGVPVLTSHLFLITGLRLVQVKTHTPSDTINTPLWSAIVTTYLQGQAEQFTNCDTLDAFHPTGCVYLPTNAHKSMFAGKLNS